MSDMDYEDELEPLKEAVGPAALRRRARRLLDQADRLQDELDARQARLDQYGPEPPEGSVVVFTKAFKQGGQRYSYAAIRVRRRWYLTSSGSFGVAAPKNWVQLVEFAAGSPIKLATEFKELGGDV
jgi:hypothetical protein